MIVSDGLVVNCHRCGGTGLLPGAAYTNVDGSESIMPAVDCPDCQGHGHLITYSGHAILHLIQFALDTGELKLPPSKAEY